LNVMCFNGGHHRLAEGDPLFLGLHRSQLLTDQPEKVSTQRQQHQNEIELGTHAELLFKASVCGSFAHTIAFRHHRKLACMSSCRYISEEAWDCGKRQRGQIYFPNLNARSWPIAVFCG